MSEFPELKWVEVDGRLVPFTYPQHEKEDGSFRRTGENNNLPTHDKDVKSELELIKSELAESRQMNQQILERLDGTFNTQVTGSNMEDAITVRQTGSLVEESLFAPNETIAPGAYSLKYHKIDDCNRYTIGARNLGSTRIEIRIRKMSEGGEWYSSTTKVAEGGGLTPSLI